MRILTGRGLDTFQILQQLNGSPQYLGTIQSTGSNVISDITALIKKGDRLMVQPDAPGYILGANASSSPLVTNSATTGVKLQADEKYYICLMDDSSAGSDDGEDYVQWISATGTTNLKVWRLV